MIVKNPLPIGTQISMKNSDGEIEYDEMFTVVAQYTHMVICQSNRSGYKQAITNADLYCRGLVEPPYLYPQPEKCSKKYRKKG